MATNKKELAQEIDKLLQSQGDVKTLEEAVRARQRLSEALADKIDAYVQYQIGVRLQGILTALTIPNVSGTTPTPLTPGPGFESLTRTR